MARYIDADALLAILDEELMCESTLHTEEHENYLKKGIRIAIGDVKRFPTADVVSKSEVAMNVVSEFANMLKCHSFDITDAHGEVIKTVIIVKSIVEVEEELKKKYTEDNK